MTFFRMHVCITSVVALAATAEAVPRPSDTATEVLHRVLAAMAFRLPTPGGETDPGVRVLVARQDYAKPTAGRCCHTLTPIRIGKRTFGRGVGSHANGLISLELDRPFQRFRAWVGIDNNWDTRGSRGSVAFVLRANGEERWHSPVCRGGDAPVEVDIDLSGIRRLDLVVTDAGDGYSWDQADWADAVFEANNGARVALEDLIAGFLPFPFFTVPPTTFEIDGQDCWEALKGWSGPEQSEPKSVRGGGTRRALVWHNANRIEVTLTATLFADPPALELGWRIANHGTTESGLIANVRSLRLEGPAGKGRMRFYSCTGGLPGMLRNTHESTGFRLDTTVLGRAKVGVKGGRSSNGNLPFFLLRDDTTEWGVAMGLGWSGQWRGAARMDEKTHTVHFEAGLAPTHFRLPPERSIRLPNVLLVPFRGAPEIGSNRLRRVLRHAIQPLLSGKPVVPPVSFNTWFVFNNGVDEDLLRDLANRAAQLGIEYFCLDAGWFDGGFPGGVGNWTVDRTKFPHGLKAVADFVHARGMKFGLWFEPERVERGTRWARDHADLIIGRRLLDLARPEARRLVLDMLDRFVSTVGVDWIRYDFNTDPLSAWNSVEDADHQGLRQIEYINGLYDLWDEVLRKHPDLFIEQCSSGGRRIDLETIRRGHTFWKSDNTRDQALMRFHEAGGNFFLPGGLLNTNLLRFRSDAETQALFAGPLGFGLDPRDLSREDFGRLEKIVAVYKKLRHWINEDAYALFPQTSDEQAWNGWEFIDRDRQSGFLVVYRGPGSRYAAADVQLHGLNRTRMYRMENVLTGETQTIAGGTLSEGWRVELAADGAWVREFRPVASDKKGIRSESRRTRDGHKH